MLRFGAIPCLASKPIPRLCPPASASCIRALHGQRNCAVPAIRARSIPMKRGMCKERCENVCRNSRPEDYAPACCCENLASPISPSKSVPIGSPCGRKAWWAALPTRPVFARRWPPPKRACARSGSIRKSRAASRPNCGGGFARRRKQSGCALCRNRNSSAAATLIFSAKEAFYKCQFAVAQEHLGFHDVSVELPGWGEKRGAFIVLANRRIELERSAAFPLRGQYLFHEQFVTAAMALPPDQYALSSRNTLTTVNSRILMSSNGDQCRR